MADGDTGHGCARLQAFLNDLGFEWFRIRASLAHGNTGDKGDRVRLTYAGTIALNAGVREVSSLDAYAGAAARARKESGFEEGKAAKKKRRTVAK